MAGWVGSQAVRTEDRLPLEHLLFVKPRGGLKRANEMKSLVVLVFDLMFNNLARRVEWLASSPYLLVVRYLPVTSDGCQLPNAVV